MAETRVGALSLLRNRNFVLLWLGQIISFIGDYFLWLAIPIMVERLTGSTLMVGLSVIFNAIPMLLLGPVAGVFVDRWDRKWTMIVSDLLRGGLVLLCLLVQTAEQVWIYYAVGFLMSCVSRFFFPSQNAALPLIVPREDELLAANGLMQTVQTVGLLAGPALAGFTIGLWGEQVAFIFDSLSFVLSAAVILLMTVPRTTGEKARASGQVAAVWSEMREGMVYLFRSQAILRVTVCLAVVQLGIGAINVVWVPFLQRTFGIGAEGLGIVDSAQGVGMVVGAVALGVVTRRMRQPLLAAVSIGIIGLMISGMGLVPAFSYIIVLSFGIGLALVPAQSVLMTMMQLAVPDLKRGRVGSAMNALTTVAGLISMAAAASLAEVVGLRIIYVVSGLIVGISALLAQRIPDPAAETTAASPIQEAIPAPVALNNHDNGHRQEKIPEEILVVTTMQDGGVE
jgi:MFS family permease